MKNHYQTLGLENNASQDEIKKAYRKLALKFHPDKNIGDSFFEELFRGIKDAYDILSNPVTKRKYDLEYNTFISKTNSKENSTYQQNSTRNRQQTYTPNPKPKRNYFELVKQINPKKFLFEKTTKIKEVFSTTNLKSLSFKVKLVFLFKLILIIIPFIGFHLKGFPGLVQILIFYVMTFGFINTIKNPNEIDSVGSGLFGLFIAPCLALLVLSFMLDDYFEIDLFSFFESNQKIEEKYKPRPSPQENELTNLQEIIDNKDALQMVPKKKSKREEENRSNRRKNSTLRDDRLPTKSSSKSKSEYKKFREEFDRIESEREQLKNHNRYKDNQLKNGASPFNTCFGKGIYSKNAWLKFDNSNASDAIVCLVRSYDKRTIRNEYIQAGSKFEMSKIPSGTYYIKVYYGNDWNPKKENFCGSKGAFEKNVTFSKSDRIGDKIIIENTSRSYTTGTITLYAVENGNMSTQTIKEKDFFEN